MTRPHRYAARRGFTMVEFIMAGILLAMLLIAMGFAMQQVVKARTSTRARIDAYLRADSALQLIRRDLISTLRRQDLYYTRLLLIDDSVEREGLRIPRDEILIFNNRLQSTRDLEYNGDGMEFETQFRIEEDESLPVLWQRRDPMPDAYPRGGGMIAPVTVGLMGLDIEVWNGLDWFEEWDSDEDGLPWAIRITVTATGAADGEDPMQKADAILRTLIPLDRSRMPLEVADARLADEIMERFEVRPEQYDDVVAAVAAAEAPPIQRSTVTPGTGELETGGASSGAASSGGPAAGGGQGGQVIETPEGTIVVPGGGGRPTFQPGNAGGPR